ncbi:MAG: NADH-quinone oxidoreductase subunit N [Chlamydiota bacterium]|nr:NADH-quinone oxidoreductase subunit N [Chlamydiota bacterium]
MNIQFQPLAILPELFIILLIFVYLSLHLFTPKSWEYRLSTIFILCFGLIAIPLFLGRNFRGVAFAGTYVQDGLSFYFKIFFSVNALMIMIMAREWFIRIERAKTEFILLILLATLGMFFLVSSNDFILLYVSLELITVSFFIMTAYHRSEGSSIEAGLKYLVLGALASGFLIYGISFLFGCTGSTQLSSISQFVASEGNRSIPLLFALILILVGLGFKIACVPFQFWVPDVYQGAPTPVTAFLSVGSKAAGIVLMLRIFLSVFPSLYEHWAPLLCALSAMTLFYGNLGAIAQKNIKRFLGYSSIGHAGFLIMGICAGNHLGISAVLYYLTAYMFSNLLIFMIVILFSKTSSKDLIQDYSGLSERSPLLAGAMFIALMSLAGVPPLAGFFGKFMVIIAITEKGLYWLALIGGVNIVISLYYYLSIVKKMYFESPQDNSAIPIPFLARMLIILCLIGIIMLGIFQGPLVDAITASIRGFC